MSKELKIILPYPNDFTMGYLSGVLKVPHRFLFLVETEQKIYKKNITFDYNELREGKIWAVGAEVLKHLFRITGVTKYNGTVQKLYSKEIDAEVEVGILIDPSIIQVYPTKERMILQAINSLLNHTENSHEKNYIIAETKDEINKIIEEIDKSDKLVIDLETSSLYPHKGKILLYVFSTAPHNGFVIPEDLVTDDLRQKFNEWFTNKHLIFHNLKFDYKWLKFNGYRLHSDLDKLDDTMLMAYCIDENESKGLKELALKYTDLGDYERELQSTKKKLCKMFRIKLSDFSYEMLPPEVLGQYAVRDGDATSQLYEIFINKLGRPSHYILMLEYSLHLIDVELNGGPINVERLKETEQEYLQKLQSYKDILSEVVGDHLPDFNPASPKQVATVLYDILGYEVIKTTDSGAPSTDQNTIENLKKQKDHPFLDALINFRKTQKFYSTYILPIKENLDYDNRIRTNFNVTGTVSGRLSSSGTINFQNIPSRDKVIKSLFTTSRKGWYIYQQDLQTAEVWMAAYLSGDEFLQNVFLSGGDFHGHVAKRVFNLDCEASEVKQKYPELRQAAKAITFGIMYLAGPGKIAEELGISKNKAKEYIDAYFNEARGLKKWLEEQENFIKNHGYIKSVFGRVRRVPEVFSPNKYIAAHAVKSAVNFLIQSPTNDLNMIAFCRTMDRVKLLGLEFYPFTLVHDSIVAEIPDLETGKTFLNIFREEVAKVFPDAFKPIGVEAEAGDSWANLTIPID